MRFNIGCSVIYPNRSRTTFPLQTGDIVLLHYGKKVDGAPHTAEGENLTLLCMYANGEAKKIAVKHDGSGKIVKPKVNVNITMDKEGRTLGGTRAALFKEGEPWFLVEKI